VKQGVLVPSYPDFMDNFNITTPASSTAACYKASLIKMKSVLLAEIELGQFSDSSS